MGYYWFTKTDRSVGISVFMGQIKILGKGVGLETPRWMRETRSCLNTAQKSFSLYHKHLSLGLQEFSKSELSLRSINLHIVKYPLEYPLRSLVLDRKNHRKFYIYHLAYAGVVFFLSLLPLLRPVAQNFLRELIVFFPLNPNICIFSFLAVCLLLKNLYSNGRVIIVFWFYAFFLCFSLLVFVLGSD